MYFFKIWILKNLTEWLSSCFLWKIFITFLIILTLFSFSFFSKILTSFTSLFSVFVFFLRRILISFMWFFWERSFVFFITFLRALKINFTTWMSHQNFFHQNFHHQNFLNQTLLYQHYQKKCLCYQKYIQALFFSLITYLHSSKKYLRIIIVFTCSKNKIANTFRTFFWYCIIVKVCVYFSIIRF